MALPVVGVLVLPAIGVRSVDELEGVRLAPLPNGVDVFLGVDEPNPTGVWRYGGRPELPPDLMLEVRRTPPLYSGSESRDKLDPVREGGREPFREPGIPDWRRVKPVKVSLS